MYDSRGGKKIFLFTKLSQLIDAIPNFWKQKVKVQGRDNNKSHQHSTKPTVTSKGITSKQSRNILEFSKQSLLQPGPWGVRQN